MLGRAVRAQVRDGALCLLGAAAEDAPFWRAYFDLDSDYAALLAPVMDDHLRGALRDCRGIRLLNQPFFEVLCSFILSANNNMRRIEGNRGPLLRHHARGRERPARISRAADVLDAGAGLGGQHRRGIPRALPLRGGERVAAGFDGACLRDLPYEEACRRIREFRGVGEKVADCVLLFSLRAARGPFPWTPGWRRCSAAGTACTARARASSARPWRGFGDCGGIAQQYLFAYAVRRKARA